MMRLSSTRTFYPCVQFIIDQVLFFTLSFSVTIAAVEECDCNEMSLNSSTMKLRELLDAFNIRKLIVADCDTCSSDSYEAHVHVNTKKSLYSIAHHIALHA